MGLLNRITDVRALPQEDQRTAHLDPIARGPACTGRLTPSTEWLAAFASAQSCAARDGEWQAPQNEGLRPARPMRPTDR